ncbi:MAG: O-acetylhomoserine aminocarboxypropyltransferase [Polymorphobacter sp.]|uniref:O-acetylhomoserine aminocarboxypropyltransferase n=1 Tax=Polymorphobacter sp. TaxID=1909290 RepID=UPI003A890080
MSERKPGFATQAIHAGAAPDPVTGSRVMPIHQTSSFVFNDADHAARLFGLQEFGNIYTRLTNPTVAALEARVAALEGGPAAVATASGHSAQHLVFHCLMEAGCEFAAARQLYGGSINQFVHSWKKYDWRVKWFDIDDPESLKAAVNPETRLVFVESVANPGGLVTDLDAVAAAAKAAGAPLVVDNTMASPYLCRPIEFGADVVIHSATKFLGGHGNSLGGVAVDAGTFDWGAHAAKYPTLTEPLSFYNGLDLFDTFGAIDLGGGPVNIALAIALRAFALRDIGPALSPFNAFMILTGIETLPLRMQRHVENAQAVAKWLEAHPKVAWVSHADLPGHRHHGRAQRYLPKGSGAVFTFGLKGGYEAANKVASSLKLFSMLANIGDTRSLVIHSASTTHRQLSDEQKIAAGALPEAVRLSVGLEDVADIIADLEQALALV